MHTNEIALRALINKLLDTTRRSNLLKFPTTTNRGSIKIDLGLSLNEFLQILSFQNQNILSIDQLNWEVPYSKYSLVDKYCKNKDLGLFKEEMSEEIPELITNFKLDFKPGTKFNISDCLRELLSKSKLNNKEKGVHSLFLA